MNGVNVPLNYVYTAVVLHIDDTDDDTDVMRITASIALSLVNYGQ